MTVARVATYPFSTWVYVIACWQQKQHHTSEAIIVLPATASDYAAGGIGMANRAMCGL